MKYTDDQYNARGYTRWADARRDAFYDLLKLDVETCDRETVHRLIDALIDDMKRTRAKALKLYPGVERDLYPEEVA